MLRSDNRPVLLDFGSARFALGDKTRSLTSVMTPGYAPLEQYSSRGNQGPWTDIYAIGAVMYRCATGDKPADVLDRITEDHLIPAETLVQNSYSVNFLGGIKWALQLKEQDRPVSLNQWLDFLDQQDEEPTRVLRETPVEPPEPTGLQETARSLEPEMESRKAASPVKPQEPQAGAGKRDALSPPAGIRKETASRAVDAKQAASPKPGVSGRWLKMAGILGALVVAIVLVFSFSGVDGPEKETRDAASLYTLGEMYENGWGREKDSNEAFRLYQLAANQRHVEAQFRLGLFYYDGVAVTQDHAEALKWFLAAAKKGHVDAQINAAKMYLLGEGAAKDDAEAIRWYEAAAAQGSEVASTALSMYFPK